MYEGFGLPALEAMAAGAPVVASDVSSLPEVVGGAGVLVEPRDEEAIATALDRLATDRVWRAELAEAGRARAREFSWERAARATWELYRQAVAEAGRPAGGVERGTEGFG